MKLRPYVFAIQHSKSVSLDVTIDRGIIFGNAYTDVVKELENKKIKEGDTIIDIYVVALDGKVINLSEDSYERLLDGETL